MAQYLAYGGVTYPPQGSTIIQELVKHFENNVSFEDLQDEINLWLILIGGPLILNRPSIRSVAFSHYIKPTNPNKDSIIYLAQIHYMLIGDADDAPNL
jgi:hypothetical protein